jgi:hypothetical protein
VAFHQFRSHFFLLISIPAQGNSEYPPALPVALACEPLKAAGKAFSESASQSVSQSEVAIGYSSPMPDSDCDTDSDADR